jgi:hypothetical protein
MNNYILTFDYELFGSGKGCVIKHLVVPTQNILKDLKKLDVKATFFIEQLEIDAIISLKESYPVNTAEYKNAVLVEQQVLEIAREGHDIQLHLHPQWYGAKYENGQWQLNFDWWRFSALPYNTLEDGTPGKYELIRDGKSSLEKRIRKVNPEYNCHSFRAGGYNVGSDKSSLDALLNNGMLVDSSVCPGFFSNSKLSQYDYTTVDSHLGFWRANKSLLSPITDSHEQKNCIQLPLVTVQSSFKEKLSLARMYATIKNKKYKKVNYNGKDLQSGPRNVDQLTNTNFDVCLSGNVQIEKLKSRIEQLAGKNSSFPVTLIGHPKDHSWFSPMKGIIKTITKSDRFITVSEFVKECK